MSTFPTERSDLRDRLQSALGAGYRVEQELASGGMSRLFLAIDLSLKCLLSATVASKLAAGVAYIDSCLAEMLAITDIFQNLTKITGWVHSQNKLGLLSYSTQIVTSKPTCWEAKRRISILSGPFLVTVIFFQEGLDDI